MMDKLPDAAPPTVTAFLLEEHEEEMIRGMFESD